MVLFSFSPVHTMAAALRNSSWASPPLGFALVGNCAACSALACSIRGPTVRAESVGLRLCSSYARASLTTQQHTTVFELVETD